MPVEHIRLILLAEVNQRLNAGETLSYERTEADNYWGITVSRSNGKDLFKFSGYADYLQGKVTSVEQLPLHELTLLLEPLQFHIAKPLTKHDIMLARDQLIALVDKLG
jgi:hypothetical protein